MNYTIAQLKETLKYLAIILVSFILLQSFVVVMHEFTHSTVAWILGYMKSPLGIVWGNPLMMTGWDEGVHYSRYFSSSYSIAESIIGASPLAVHTIIIILGLILMQTKGILEKNGFFMSYTGS